MLENLTLMYLVRLTLSNYKRGKAYKPESHSLSGLFISSCLDNRDIPQGYICFSAITIVNFAKQDGFVGTFRYN